ncbi:MAG: hypothetical protein QM778_21190 [Myxococcales bacterium]
MSLHEVVLKPARLAPARSRWRAIEGRILADVYRIHVAWFTALVAGVMLLRNGAHGFNFNPATDPTLKCFADLSVTTADFRCHGLVIFALPKLLGLESLTQWKLLHAGLTAGALLLAATLTFVTLGTGPRGRLALLWISASSMPSVLLNPREHYDVYTILGGTLLGLAPSPVVAALGGIVIGAANPEQALVAAAAWLIVAWGSRPRRVVIPGALGLGASAVCCMLYAALSAHTGDTRLEILPAALGLSLRVAMQSGTMGLYACYGAAWLLVAGWLLLDPASTARKRRVALGMLLVPGLVTLATRDGTRVFVCTAWPAFLAFLVQSLEETREDADQPMETLSALLVLSVALLPAFVRMKSGFSMPGINGWFRLKGL